MSFLDTLPALEPADCETCPTPHSICEFGACGICERCPTAKARREQAARELAQRQAAARTQYPRTPNARR